MSLRVRLVLWLGCVLAVTLGLGFAVAGWHANASVRAEMRSALAAGHQSVANGIAEIAGSATAPREPRHLVATFDGNRHVLATLTDDQGAVVATSSVQPPAHPVPSWFVDLIDPALKPVVVPVPADGAITLTADATNEVGEVWGQLNDAVRMLAVFFGLTVLLIHWTAGHVLAPLERLSEAFGRIGAGDYAARLDAAAPPELDRLVSGFNRMADQLGQAEVQNQRLREQLLTLQEEERAELARDLHDEIGPFLFAAAIDAASIRPLLDASQSSDAANRAEAISHAITHMQSHIRAILGRLRPLGFGSVGMADAIDTIITFWRGRHPEITFALTVTEEDDGRDEAVRDTVCRVVRESVCNAIRHGAPKHIEISVTRDGEDLVVRVDDDGAGPGPDGVTPGFGLVGMSERVRAQAGTLAITGREGGRGLAVTARLPCDAVA